MSTSKNTATPEMIHRTYDVKLNVNVNETWREKIGAALRELAARVDKRYCPGVRIMTKPRLPDETVFEAVKAGYRRMQEVLELECQHALYDEVILERKPWMFGKDKSWSRSARGNRSEK